MFSLTGNGLSFSHAIDGLSVTALLGETLPAECGHNGLYLSNNTTVGFNIPLNTFTAASDLPSNAACTQPPSIQARVNKVKSRHPGGAHVALCDGAVRFFDEFTELSVLPAIGSRRLGEVVMVP